MKVRLRFNLELDASASVEGGSLKDIQEKLGRMTIEELLEEAELSVKNSTVSDVDVEVVEEVSLKVEVSDVILNKEDPDETVVVAKEPTAIDLKWISLDPTSYDIVDDELVVDIDSASLQEEITDEVLYRFDLDGLDEVKFNTKLIFVD